MLSVRVLGELAIELDDVPVDLPSGRGARSLLGLLALDRRLHSRSALAAQLWPDVLDESARTSLRSALAALRRSLEPDSERYLVATRERVGLTDAVRTDAVAFGQHTDDGRLQDAIDLYRGDLLSGLDDDWVLSARDEWRERAGGVLGRLADDADAAGDAAGAITHTRRIVALDPLAEDGQRALIGRLASAGDRPAALAAYTRYADRLRTELRIAPSAATRALADELRSDEPETAAAATESGVVAPASGTVTLLFTDLVGSTELLVALGDDEAERLRRVHFGLLRDVALTHAGHEVKSLGDGLMVAFGSSVDAVGCAVGIQQAVERHNRRTGSDSLRVRVGLNVGEPIRDEDDYFGTPVVVAKRLCDRAEGGQILASELVRLLIGARGGFDFRSVGELDLKGLGQRVASCEVGWEPAGTEGIALPAELARDQSTLVGRAEELAALGAAWETARSGRLGVVGVAGEPGIGKTRLVSEFCRGAHADGATVLLGRSHEEAQAPYLPFVEALRQYIAACPIDELRLQMGPRRAILARLVPELGAAGEDARFAAANAPGGDAGERHALFEAVASLLGEVARSHPAILVLDDLHWADEASLLLVRHIARAAADTPLLILGTYRATEVHDGDPLSAALAELRRARVLEPLELAGLGTDDVGTLIRGLGAELADGVADAVAQRTEGNPFFVEEIVRHLDAGGKLTVPASVNDLLRRRLARLSDPARRALSAAAVLGREFDLDVLERVAGDGGEDLLAAIDEALAEQLLVAGSDRIGRFAFVHALIRESVHDELSAARRPQLHRRAAEALEELYPSRLDEHADLLAHHYVQAGDDVRSLDHQLRAARVAGRVYAPETAIDHYGAVLETAARLALSVDADTRLRQALLERGWMRQCTGDHEAGVADYGRALDAARAAGDRELQAQALDSLGFAEKPFDAARAEAHQQEGLVIAAEVGDAALQVAILSRMSLARTTNLDLAGAVEAGERAREIAEHTGDERDRAKALDALKLAALHLGNLDQLEALTAELGVIQRRHGDLMYLEWTVLESAFVPLANARWEAADDRLQEAFAIHRQVRDAFCAPMLHDASCWLERSRGDLGKALADGRLAVQLTERAGPTWFGAWTRATLGWALLDLRAVADAVVMLEGALAQAATHSDHLLAAGQLAWARVLAGDDAGAAVAVSDAEVALANLTTPAGGAYLYGFGATAALARAHLAAGRPERGAEIVAPLHAGAAQSGWHEATAATALVLALCHRARDNEDAATQLLQTAIDVAAEHGLPGVEWEARAAAGQHEESAAIVQRLAATVPDERLAAGFVQAAQR